MKSVIGKAIEHFGLGLSVIVLFLAILVYLLPDTNWRSEVNNGWYNEVLYFLIIRLSNIVDGFEVPIMFVTLVLGVIVFILYLHDLLNLQRGLKYLGLAFSFPVLILAIHAYQFHDLYWNMSDRSGVWYMDVGAFVLIDLPVVIVSFWFPVLVTTIVLASAAFCLNMLIVKVLNKLKHHE